MKKLLQTYGKEIDKLLQHEKKMAPSIILKHQTMITFFQHERLIHLLITLAVMFLSFGFFTLFLCFPSFPFFALTILLFILLGFYLFHYYFLENNVQKLYQQYIELEKNKH